MAFFRSAQNYETAYKEECEGQRKRSELIEAEIARLKGELGRIREAISTKGGTEHAPTEWAYLKACEVIDDHKARLAEAMKALEPFADIADLIDSETEGMSETDELALHFHDYLMASWSVALFRAARRVREGGKEDG